jgi:bis(5'-nucleosyl)-tetraphosphatase (symmetrical)
MSDYVIGDIQGCFKPLMRLLNHIQFNEKQDRLWFVGDLVNRGPQSLEVLRFVKNLPIPAPISLGNHDLYLLSKIFECTTWSNKDDTLEAILAAPDKEELGHWLRHQSILYQDESLGVLICHAGIAPMWNLHQAKTYAIELENVLRGSDYKDYLSNMYGNHADLWDPQSTGIDRLRLITNYFTRMRLCDLQGRLNFSYKGPIAAAPPDLLPWFALPNRPHIPFKIIFGHWAALGGSCGTPNIYAIDTGCLWGNLLTALRLQDMKIFAVNGL